MGALSGMLEEKNRTFMENQGNLNEELTLVNSNAVILTY